MGQRFRIYGQPQLEKIMELRLRTLTPLHVGDGSSLHSLDYVIYSGRFYRTSRRFFENFLKHLEQQDIQLSERFVDWAGELSGKMQNLEEERRRNPRGGKDFNQQLSDLRNRFSLYEFAKQNGQEIFFLELLQQQKTPGLPVFSEDKRMQEIRGFQRDADERVYVPGSSIKGCIRTALLYHFLEEHAEHQAVRALLKKSLDEVRKDKDQAQKRRFKFNAERHRRHFGEELEHLAFRAGMIPEKGGAPRFTEAQDDLLKCLLLSDAAVSADGVGIEKIDLYLVKKLPRGAGYEAQRQRQAPAVEAVQPGQLLTCRLQVNVELLLYLHRRSREDEKGIKVGEEKHWIGWHEKAQVAFGLSQEDFERVPEDAKADHPAIKALEQKSIDHILQCCKAFSDAQAHALAYWQKNEFCLPKHNAGHMARDLQSGTEYVFSARGVRLHLGFATGFEGMTSVLHLLERHKEDFATIMELFGIGDSPSAWKNRRPGQVYQANPDKFPKSKRMATRPGLILPMGWLEWADDPLAGSSPVFRSVKQSEVALPPSKPATPSGPIFLKGSLKAGVQLYAELIGAGNPGRFKLYIREDHQPIVEVRYAAGFRPEHVGRIAKVLVKNVQGKDQVTAIGFLRFE